MKEGLLKELIYKINSISLKWKLLIPFLFFALSGTTILVYIGLKAQQDMIQEQERKGLLHHQDHFMEEIESTLRHVLCLSEHLSTSEEIKRGIAEGNKELIKRLILPAYINLHRGFGIGLMEFYSRDGSLLLEFHSEENSEKQSNYPARVVLESIRRGTSIGGIEKGRYRFAIKGVSPVYYQGEVVGGVGISYFLDTGYLDSIKKRWSVDIALYEIKESGAFIPVAESGRPFSAFMIKDFMGIVERAKKVILIGPEKYPDRSFLYFPLKDYRGRNILLVEISIDRHDTLKRLRRTRKIMTIVGLCGIGVSFLLTFIVIYMFLRPIKRIIAEADEIAEEKRERHVEYGASDEIGTLTEALNRMLDALRLRRRQIQEYAQNLEKRVAERTSDLVNTMENYRRLVENIPLVVYRVLEDGTTEFINPYLTDSLGYSIEEAVGNKNFWRDVICGGEEGFSELLEECFQKGRELKKERRIRDKKGRFLDFIDHAMPYKDQSGRALWIDGTLIDITEMKRLQEKALRSEEIRIIGEISSSVAHEMRNPLATVGGFARRLMNKLPAQEPNRYLARVIVSEVSRMEHFLKVLFSTIKSIEIEAEPVNLKEIISMALHYLRDEIERKGVILRESIGDLPLVSGDKEKLIQAFESIIRHSIVMMPAGERLGISGTLTRDRILITLRHKVENLSDEDLSQFFYPHLELDHRKSVSDFPLSRIILHRHGVKVDVKRWKKIGIVLELEFPTISPTS